MVHLTGQLLKTMKKLQWWTKASWPLERVSVGVWSVGIGEARALGGDNWRMRKETKVESRIVPPEF